jgi:hypothetical protein
MYTVAVNIYRVLPVCKSLPDIFFRNAGNRWLKPESRAPYPFATTFFRPVMAEHTIGRSPWCEPLETKQE